MDSVLTTLLTGVVAVVVGAIAQFLDRSWRRARGSTSAAEAYSDRVQRLTRTLTESAGEVESVAREMSELLERRTEALVAAEQSLAEVEVREKALAVRLENLRQVAPDSVKVFEELLDRKMELSSRSSRVYFIWGVVATVVVGLVGLLLAPYVAAAL